MAPPTPDGMDAQAAPDIDTLTSQCELIVTTTSAREPLIRASQVRHHSMTQLPAKPVYSADPLNLFVVVELGDHHATILDGDKLVPIHRFATRLESAPSGRGSSTTAAAAA